MIYMTFLALQIEMKNLDWGWQHLMWVTAKETKFLWKSTAHFQSLFPQFCLTLVLGNCLYWGYHHLESRTVYIFMSSPWCILVYSILHCWPLTLSWNSLALFSAFFFFFNLYSYSLVLLEFLSGLTPRGSSVGLRLLLTRESAKGVSSVLLT